MRLNNCATTLTAVFLLVFSVFASAPVAAQPQADLSVTVSDSTVTPGEIVTVSYTLGNVGNQSGTATSISVEQIPGDWDASSDSSGWQANRNSWLATSELGSGDTFEATMTVAIPDNASQGEYALTATGYVTPDVTDEASATVTVTEPQPRANLSVEMPDGPVEPGEEFTATYTLENTGEVSGTATSIDITQAPADWAITSDSSSWQANQYSWIDTGQLEVGTEYEATAQLLVPENASEGTYSLNASGNVAANVSDAADTSLVVREFSPTNYDSDGDGSVSGDLTGVLSAVEDFNRGNLSITQALEVIGAYNG